MMEIIDAIGAANPIRVKWLVLNLRKYQVAGIRPNTVETILCVKVIIGLLQLLKNELKQKMNGVRIRSTE